MFVNWVLHVLQFVFKVFDHLYYHYSEFFLDSLPVSSSFILTSLFLICSFNCIVFLCLFIIFFLTYCVWGLLLPGFKVEFFLPFGFCPPKTPWWLRGESICPQCGRPRFNPWVGKIPWRRKSQPTPVFLPGRSHQQRSLIGYSPWGCKESDTTERLHFLLRLVQWFVEASYRVRFVLRFFFVCLFDFPLMGKAEWSGNPICWWLGLYFCFIFVV